MNRKIQVVEAPSLVAFEVGLKVLIFEADEAGRLLPCPAAWNLFQLGYFHKDIFNLFLLMEDLRYGFRNASEFFSY